jgi:hypothetical protein
VTDEELIARVREELQRARTNELGANMEETSLQIIANYDPVFQALDTLARRLEELKGGIAAVEAADEAWKQLGDVDQLPAALGALYSLLHPEPQEEEGQHDTTHIFHNHPGEIVPQALGKKIIYDEAPHDGDLP